MTCSLLSESQIETKGEERGRNRCMVCFIFILDEKKNMLLYEATSC